MKLGVYGATSMTSDLQTDASPLVVRSKINPFMEMIVKTSRANHDMSLDASHL